jgi:hypothetical protein
MTLREQLIQIIKTKPDIPLVYETSDSSTQPPPRALSPEFRALLTGRRQIHPMLPSGVIRGYMVNAVVFVGINCTWQDIQRIEVENDTIIDEGGNEFKIQHLNKLISVLKMNIPKTGELIYDSNLTSSRYSIPSVKKFVTFR